MFYQVEKKNMLVINMIRKRKGPSEKNITALDSYTRL